jgi:hypothetical protein
MRRFCIDCWNSCLARFVRGIVHFLEAIMSLFCSPATTPALALAAQEKLLAHFLKRSVFEVKATKSHHVNYVVIRRKDHPDNFGDNNPIGDNKIPSAQEIANQAASSAIASPSTSHSYSKVSTEDIEAVLKESGNNVETNEQLITRITDDNKKTPGKKQKTLILMHGFGLGLGFFYGN